jgi:NAD(P)-dependent dehydrogenase (short-subunit alcohol dehydrogenase family)
MTSLAELMSMRGHRALITGATGFIGRVIAETLAELGADLILVYRPGEDFLDFETRLRETWPVRVISLPCDLESEAQRVSMICQVKADGIGLSCLVNNAAFVGSSNLEGWIAPFAEQSITTWRRAFEVNLTAAFQLSQAFSPELQSSSRGNIINIGSIYGEYAPDWRLYEGTEMGNPAAYAASKGGLIQLSRWLATTMAPRVRVNVISPGGVLRGQPRNFVERYVAKTPLGRMANEDDFRGAIAYLATPMSSYVTGQTLRVDGGWGAW